MGGKTLGCEAGRMRQQHRTCEESGAVWSPGQLHNRTWGLGQGLAKHLHRGHRTHGLEMKKHGTGSNVQALVPALPQDLGPAVCNTML